MLQSSWWSMFPSKCVSTHTPPYNHIPYHFATRNTKMQLSQFLSGKQGINGKVLKCRCQIWMGMKVLIKDSYIWGTRSNGTPHARSPLNCVLRLPRCEISHGRSASSQLANSLSAHSWSHVLTWKSNISPQYVKLPCHLLHHPIPTSCHDDTIS